MPFIDEDRYLTLQEMQNNADIIILFMRTIGWNESTIASILGNMQAESTINPNLTERGGGGGYGLVQWTPRSDLTRACNQLGIAPDSDGYNQLAVLRAELERDSRLTEFQWYSSRAFISPYFQFGVTEDMIRNYC